MQPGIIVCCFVKPKRYQHDQFNHHVYWFLRLVIEK